MSELILLFMCLIVISIMAFVKFKDIMSPAFLMCGSITFIIFVFLISQRLWPHKDYTNIVFIIGASSVFFLLGSLLGRYKYTFRRRIINRQKNISNYEIVISRNVLVCLLIIMYILGVVSGGYRYVINLVYKEAGSYEKQLMASDSFMEILYQVLAALTFIVIYTLIIDFLKGDFKNKWLKIFCILPYNIVCVICETRFPIFVEIMFVLSCINIFFRFEKGKNIKVVISVLLRGAVVIIFFFIAMAFLKIGTDRNMFLYVIKYLTVGLYGLSDFCSTFTFSLGDFGKYSFNNVYRVLNMLGFNIDSMYSALGNHYWVNEEFGAANLYTGLMTLLHDFNYVGTCVFVFVFGFITTRMYYRIVCGDESNMSFMIMLYSSMMYLLVMIWIDLNPINYLLSSSFIVRTLVIYLGVKFINNKSYIRNKE